MKKLLFLLPLAALVFTGCSPTDGEHTVTFVYDPAKTTGTTMENVEVEVKHGETVKSPAIPTVDKFYFNAWYGDEALQTAPFDFDTKIEKDITLYGEWGPWVKAIDYRLTGTINGWDIGDDTYTFTRVTNNLYEITADLYAVQSEFQVTIGGAWAGQMGFTKVNTEGSDPSTSWRGAPGGGATPNIQCIQDGEYKITVDADNLEDPIKYERLGEPTKAAPVQYNVIGSWSDPAFDNLSSTLNGQSTKLIEGKTDGTLNKKFFVEANGGQGITFAKDQQFLVNKGYSNSDKANMLGFDDVKDSTTLSNYIVKGDNNQIKVVDNSILNIEVDTTGTAPVLVVKFVEYYTSTINLEVSVSNYALITATDKNFYATGTWTGTPASEVELKKQEATTTTTTTTPDLYKASFKVKRGTEVTNLKLDVKNDTTSYATVISDTLNSAFEFSVGDKDITLKMTVDFTGYSAGSVTEFKAKLTSHTFVDMTVDFTAIPTTVANIGIRGSYNGWDNYIQVLTLTAGSAATTKVGKVTLLVDTSNQEGTDDPKPGFTFVFYGIKSTDKTLNSEADKIKFQVGGKDLEYKTVIKPNTKLVLTADAEWSTDGGKSFAFDTPTSTR